MVDNKLSDLTFAVPTYNRNDYLSRLLESIPSSSGARFAISDNGNYVHEETIKKHISTLKISRSNEIIEMYDNWNKAISLVDTKWFLIPSDDDLYYSEKFLVLENAIRDNPDADIIIFGHHVIDENDNILSTWVPEKPGVYESPNGFNCFKYGVNARFPSIVFKTAFVQQMGGIDSTYSFTAGDSLLIQKCLINGKAVFINEVIGAYRTWTSNFTNQLIASKKWLDKIDRWQDELAIEVSKSSIFAFNALKVKDEVYARNLLQGILNVRKSSGLIKAFGFFIINRYPFKSKIKTQLLIIKTILLG